MLKPVRVEAGLGNPPKEYTNNDTESGNFMIKHALQFDPKQPHEFVEEMRNIVEEQYRNEDRAVFGTGPYEVRPEFQHFVVSENQLAKLTPEERISKVEKFVKCGMDGKRRLNQTKKRKSINQESSVLSVTASSSGISTIPFSILQKMFGKANDLVRDSDGKAWSY